MTAARTTKETFKDIAAGVVVLWWRFFDWLAVVPWKTLVFVCILLMVLVGGVLGAPQVAILFILASLIIKVVAGGKHSADVAASQAVERAEKEQLERTAAEAHLQALQAQIEPHFLFNTLATIRRLYQTDLARGRSTLADFIHYLKSALPGMRASETTLGREVDLIAAYLDVLRVRMGSRLEYEIDVSPSLRDHLIPPLSLATLVENAIKHGIGDLPEGGKISVRAWIDGNALFVRVADTGVGIHASGGTGMGLANLRVRLRGLYGDTGQLVLASNDPRGLSATLSIPVRGTPVAMAYGRE